MWRSVVFVVHVAYETFRKVETMMGYIRGWHVAVAMVFVALTAPQGWGGGVTGGIDDHAAMVAISPDSADFVTVDTDAGSFLIRVFTEEASQSPDPIAPMAELDPSQPTRTATTIVNPFSASTIQINFVELMPVDVSGLGGVSYQLNGHLPFTREAELRFMAEGLDIRQTAPLQMAGDEPDDTCWVTGEPILEIPVIVPMDNAADRDTVPTYNVEIMSLTTTVDQNGPIRRRDGGDGGTPGGSPDPGFLMHTGNHGTVVIQPETGDGGTPGGSPSPDGERK